MIFILKTIFSVRLSNGISMFACVCLFLAGPMALFMDQPSNKKHVNSIFSNKKCFATVFSVINFQKNKWNPKHLEF